MPTLNPRYQVTDTGQVRRLLDEAALAWPELAGDRKALLLRLAETGARHLPPARADLEAELRAHGGDWVAIRGSRLLIADPQAEVVVGWLRDHGERADSVFRVPAGEGEIPAEHGVA